MIAFNKKQLENLEFWLLAKKLRKDGFVSKEADLTDLERETNLYHPGIFMRVFLFVVGLVGSLAVIGLVFWTIRDSLDEAWKLTSILIGFGFLAFFELSLIKNFRHYKTGFTEAVLYVAVILFSIGLSGYLDNESLSFLAASALCLVASLRYVDALLSAVSFVLFALFMLMWAEEVGGWATQILPFVVILVYALFYRLSVKYDNPDYQLWYKPLYALQAICLLLAYAGGNYLVVRELNAALNGVVIEPGTDIQFAWFFYAFTVLVPVYYLYRGVKTRNRIFVWVGMITAGFSVFTFKFYYSFGHPEVTLTISGLFVLGLSYYVLNKLKQPRKGVTRDRLSSANLDFLTAEGILISQTLSGASTPQPQEDLFQGGQFGGGGASSDFN